MILDQVELHNIEQVVGIDGRQGVRLQRVPESVRQHLNPGAQEKMLRPCGSEIRFVSDGRSVRVTLSSEERTGLIVFFGLFQSTQRFTIGREPRTVEITMSDRLQQSDPALWSGMAFSPRVCRLALGGWQKDAPLFFHGIEGSSIRPPKPDELPGVRYLAYGTSITQGSQAMAPHLSYVSQAARRLGADAINLGVGGSAYCERELADHIADRGDWDIATLSLSVNMIGAGFSLQEFQDRVSFMIDRVGDGDSHRPVVCITIYPHFRDLGMPSASGQDKGTAEQFRQALRDAADACPHPNVRLLEGTEILRDFSGLTPDLLHPSDSGMILMGENLARCLAPEVAGLPPRCTVGGARETCVLENA